MCGICHSDEGSSEPIDWCEVHNVPVWCGDTHRDCDYEEI